MAKRKGNEDVGDFAAIESAMYGNVEDDEELMNELLGKLFKNVTHLWEYKVSVKFCQFYKKVHLSLR